MAVALGDLFDLSGCAVMEWRAGGLTLTTPHEPWLVGLFGLDGGVTVKSPYLAQFLADAADFWAAGRGGRLRSGYWQEEGETYEALAGYRAGRPTLLVQHDPEEFFRQKEILQVGRENLLRLEEARHLQGELSRLRRLAYLDELTGLYNRRGFVAQAEQQLEHARRYGHPLALFVLDLDGLGAINDQHGHHAGDTALVRCAALIREGFPHTDVAGRLGGDEFAVAVPGAYQAGAEALLGRLERSLEAFNRTTPLPFTLGLSAGYALFTPADTLTDLLRRADLRMYHDKRAR